MVLATDPDAPMNSPTNPDTITVAPRRSPSVKTLLTSVVVFTIGVIQILRAINGGHVIWWVLGGLALLCGFLGFFVGLLGVLRRKPVLIADSQGVTFSLIVSDQNVLPWSQIAGFELVGSGMSRQLAITVIDLDAALANVHQAIRPNVLNMNKKYSLTAAAYLPTHMLDAKSEELVDQLRSLAVRHIQA
jgi:hypothetical protein